MATSTSTILVALLVTILYVQSSSSQDVVPLRNLTGVTFSFWRGTTFVQERKKESVYLNITLEQGVQEATITFYNPEPQDTAYTILENDTVHLSRDELGPSATLVHYFIVKGRKLGVAQVYARGDVDGNQFEDVFTNYLIRVIVWAPPYKELVDWFLIAWVSVTYVSMGVKIDLKLVWSRLRRPWPVFIGFLCQFVLMPLTAFSLAKILKLDTFSAIGLVTDGAAPGGWASNILSILFGLDFVLSLTMTTCSTLLAIGTMPFNLWLYGSPFLNEELGVIVLPFRLLIMQLGLLLIPIIVGMLIGYFLPKVGKYVEKALKPLAISLIVLAIGLGIPVKMYAFLTTWQVYVAALTLPVIGGTLGIGISLICRLTVRQSLTVGLETGLQNALLATTMLALAFWPPEKDLMARVPLLISLLSLGQCLVLLIGKMIYEKVTGKTLGGEPDEGTDNDEDKLDENAVDENANVEGKDMEMKEVHANLGYEYDVIPPPSRSSNKVIVFDGKTISTQTVNMDTGRLHTLD